MIRHSATFLFVFVGVVSMLAQPRSINEEKFVEIGGIEQWVTIKGDDISKPAVLLLHGGPGNAISAYADTVYSSWKKDFILVNWDQRGAARTYGRNAPAEVTEDFYIENPITVAEMTADAIALTEYLTKHLEKQKITIIGTSWGSILGVTMASQRPDLYDAYIGNSQFVSFPGNLTNAYRSAYQMAKSGKDTLTMKTLRTLGRPPYGNARHSGQLLRIVKKYERKNSIAPPDTWSKPAPPYDNEIDSKNRYDGDDYSFINAVGHKALGIKPMLAEIDLTKNNLEFKIPVYFVQGEEDILTSKEVTKPYFDKIKATKKEYFLLPNAGHGQNQAVVAKEHEILKSIHSKK
ncbi:alpha/beta hydrolase [uncultured Kriegella sp.]|uniref:alpha/beta hydrolase n=1 Tax=uncultured Kriegella sp. TaxID=1798910 RepID=UPI0030D9649F|tara:strand:+ start:305239 stop:306282 length:1044 start_codon:yes stop_codon:yes gene_type:complete